MSRLIYIVWYPAKNGFGWIDSVWATRDLAEAYALLKGYGGDEPESCVQEWVVMTDTDRELNRLITDAARAQVALDAARRLAQETWCAAVRFGRQHCPDAHTERLIQDECGDVCRQNPRFGLGEYW